MSVAEQTVFQLFYHTTRSLPILPIWISMSNKETEAPLVADHQCADALLGYAAVISDPRSQG